MPRSKAEPDVLDEGAIAEGALREIPRATYAELRKQNALLYEDERARKRFGLDLHACYVIGWQNARPVKLGLATTPSFRLSELQVGNPYQLWVHYWVWLENRSQAEACEHATHRLLEEKYGRTKLARSEWFECNALQAYEMAQIACLQLSIDYRLRIVKPTWAE